MRAFGGSRTRHKQLGPAFLQERSADPKQCPCLRRRVDRSPFAARRPTQRYLGCRHLPMLVSRFSASESMLCI